MKTSVTQWTLGILLGHFGQTMCRIQVNAELRVCQAVAIHRQAFWYFIKQSFFNVLLLLVAVATSDHLAYDGN